MATFNHSLRQGIIDRRDQILLIFSFVAFSWLAMQAVHEFGHVLGAWASDGKVRQVVLYPTLISRTDLADNPHPLMVALAGPLLGMLLPVCFWFLARLGHMPGAFLLRFFAGFCLVANGMYLGIGCLEQLGDAADLMAGGVSGWLLLAGGAMTAAAGFYLWHDQGTWFGMGSAQGKVDRKAAILSLVLLLGILAAEFLGGNR